MEGGPFLLRMKDRDRLLPIIIVTPDLIRVHDDGAATDPGSGPG